MANNYILIMVTCSTRKEAHKVVNCLLTKKLVSCANIAGEVVSHYWWKGKIESAAETLVMMKSVKANFKKIEAQIRRLHSYEVPEIIAMPIILGSKDYLDWIGRSVV